MPPHASEATRLLCAGTYLDPAYRDRVIEELYLHEERIVAPSLGFDAARVLAHALRARRLEMGWAALIVGLWIVGWPLTGGAMTVYLLPGLLLAMGVAVRGDDSQVPAGRRAAAFAMRWLGRLVFAVLLAATVVAAFSSKEDAEAARHGSVGGLKGFLLGLLPTLSSLVGGRETVSAPQAWLALVLFLLLALCAGVQRGLFARALGGELAPERFPDAASDPAERAESPRFQRLKKRIRLEQHFPLIMYSESRPFCGAGQAYDTWVLAGHSRRTLWAVLAASAAVGVAAALVVTLGLGGAGNGDHRGADAASSTPATTAEPSPTTYTSQDPGTDTPSPSADEPPAGYTAYDDPQGFRIAVPDGWQQQRSTVTSRYGMDIVNYRDSTGHHRLQVYEVQEASPDESFNLYLSTAVPKPPGFRTLSLVNLDSGDFTGSRLEYLADSLRGEPDIGTWHVVDERFQAADGKLYAIAAYGPESDGRDDEHEVLTTALNWFCPPFTTCSN